MEINMDFENKETEDQQETIEKPETAENKEEKMFTQEQVNEIVKKRLAKYKKEGNAEELKAFENEKAELSKKENLLSCREYLLDQGYPKEFLEILDTTDVEKFKEKAKQTYDLFQSQAAATRQAPPLADLEFIGTGNSLKDAFSAGVKHKPKQF